jgi:hypothetical protein
MCNDFQESMGDRKMERGEDGDLTGVYLVGREGSSEQIGVSAFVYACSDTGASTRKRRQDGTGGTAAPRRH